MDLSMINVIITLLTGLIVGSFASIFGIGGGIIVVPVLIYVFGLNSNSATSTSLAIVIITTITSTIAYIRKKTVDYKTAFAFLIFAIPGSLSGTHLANYINIKNYNIDYLQIAFFLIIFIFSCSKLISTKFIQADKKIPFTDLSNSKARIIKSVDGETFGYNIKLYPKVILAFFGGFIGSSLGLGGGIIYIPILTSLLGIPYIISVSTSSITMVLANSLALPFRFEFINWNMVFLISMGCIISATIIPKFIHKINSKYLINSFWSFTLIVSIFLIIKIFI